MRLVGLLLLAVGSWGFFRPEKVAEVIRQNFYRQDRSRPDAGKQRMVRPLAAVWILVGLLLLVKG